MSGADLADNVLQAVRMDHFTHYVRSADLSAYELATRCPVRTEHMLVFLYALAQRRRYFHIIGYYQRTNLLLEVRAYYAMIQTERDPVLTLPLVGTTASGYPAHVNPGPTCATTTRITQLASTATVGAAITFTVQVLARYHRHCAASPYSLLQKHGAGIKDEYPALRYKVYQDCGLLPLISAWPGVLQSRDSFGNIGSGTDFGLPPFYWTQDQELDSGFISRYAVRYVSMPQLCDVR
eukprot:3940955-Rhodomonas_salina.2